MGLLALGLLHDPDDGGEYFTEAFKHYGYYTGQDFVVLGSRLGLPEKPIRAFIRKLAIDQKKITDTINHSYMPDDMKGRAIQMVKDRMQALQLLGPEAS
ncbi:hypothetical protein FKG94_27075 [Exilibacterium tricleocarpae]|uniref:Uncharacterized protein n=1 Tax=Exilibacterium tricleocarpae TaxID=2591008 RepID=A0A545SNE4_9GAMM|nr:hypothetical protein [Exilibacterium tricleocarpae]TQV66498.1 hypothetical protein FKG94_27075 [Exilibacterium tricleocarpae]